MKIKDLPKFETKEDKFNWLAKNCDDLIYEAKSQIKYADAMIIPAVEFDKELVGKETKTSKDNFDQSSAMQPDEEGVIKARVVINTTNLFDSHKDVHISGLWNKSLKENKRIKFKQEHGSRFKDIIADKDDLKAYTKEYDWNDLGFNAIGKTEALVFDATIRKSRNEEMYNEYKDGNVDNHSVGMQYSKILFAMNSDKDQHAQYKINWDKYYPVIANKAEVDREGYFWPVLEAKVREGSAVPDGSNFITPTLSRKNDPSRNTHSDDKTELAAKALATEELKKFIINL